MGRRSPKEGGVAATPDFDTVGMTILPGHPLPEWAEPQAQVAESPQAWPPESLEAYAAMAAAQAAQAAAAPAPAAAETPVHAEAPHESLVAAAMATAGVAAGVGAATAHGFPGAPDMSGYPAAPGFPQPSAPAYGAAPMPSSPGAPPAPAMPGPAMPGPGMPAAGMPAAGAGAPPAGFPAGTFAAPHPSTGVAVGTMAAGAALGAGHDPMMAMGTAPAQAPQAQAGPTGPTAAYGQPSVPSQGSAHPAAPMPPAQAPVAPGSAEHGATMTATLPPPAEAPPAGGSPSEGWNSPDRPQLSPEHVALLTWWADMIAKGQFPAPTGVPGEASAPAPAAPRKQKAAKAPRVDGSSRGVLVGVGLAVVATAGLAVAFGPGLVGSILGDDPEPVPVTELTMPAAVGDLVAVTGPEVGAQLQSLIGFGLRPAGVTVTAGYGTDPASPVVLGALATTVAPAADATGQLNQWAEQAGVELGELVPGAGATAGVTCAAAPATETAPAGSMCVWSATGMSGRTFVVSTEPEAALERTAELRTAM